MRAKNTRPRFRGGHHPPTDSRHEYKRVEVAQGGAPGGVLADDVRRQRGLWRRLDVNPLGNANGTCLELSMCINMMATVTPSVGTLNSTVCKGNHGK
jgi:hypothetical protein